MKKVIALLLVVLTVAGMFAGCGAKEATSDQNPQSDAAASADGKSNTTEMETVRVTYPAFGNYDDTKLVEEKVNEITVAKLGIKVILDAMEPGQYMTQQNMLITTSTDIDLIVAPYSSENYEAGAFVDLTDMLETIGAETKEIIGDNIAACIYKGAIYGLPNMHEYAKTPQIIYNVEMAEAAGVDMSAVKTLDDLDAVLAKVIEVYPNMSTPMLCGSNGQSASSRYQFWDNAGVDRLGVVMYNNPTQVVNLFETEEYKELVTTLHTFQEKGYLNKDAATMTDAWSELLESEMTFAVLMYNNEMLHLEYSPRMQKELGCIAMGDAVKHTENITTFMWGIPVLSKKPEAAMKVLNLLYTDSEVEELLCNGIEGRNYVLNEEGLCTFPDGVDSTNTTYSPNIGWIVPNGWIIHEWDTGIRDYAKKMDEYNDRAVVSPLFGFIFDSSPVLNEITACTNVINQYCCYAEEDCSVSVEDAIAEINAALKDAGIDRIIEEKQRQLDAFYAAK